MLYGFGYLPSTNEYKVVRMLFRGDIDQPEGIEWVGGHVQVYTIGGGSGWRGKGEITNSLCGYGIFANEALYWVDDREMKIVAFDLADEEFHFLPPPPFVVPGQNNFLRLRVLGGLLCAVDAERGRSVNVWLLKKMESCITTDIKKQESQSWCWHKEFSVALDGLSTDIYEPFTTTKSGELLMWYRQNISSPDNHLHSILSCYDPKTATLKRLDMDMLFREAIPHMHTFVSLKALGEEDVMIIGSDEALLEQELPELNWGVAVEASGEGDIVIIGSDDGRLNLGVELKVLGEEDVKIIGSDERLLGSEMSEPYQGVKHFSFKFEATSSEDNSEELGYNVLCWSKEHNLEWRARLVLDHTPFDF